MIGVKRVNILKKQKMAKEWVQQRRQDVYEQLKMQEEGPLVIYPSSVSAITL